MKNLRQRTSVTDYANQFSGLHLEVPHMHPADAIFQFVKGLKPQIRLHVEQKRPSTGQSGFMVVSGTGCSFQYAHDDSALAGHHFPGSSCRYAGGKSLARVFGSRLTVSQQVHKFSEMYHTVVSSHLSLQMPESCVHCRLRLCGTNERLHWQLSRRGAVTDVLRNQHMSARYLSACRADRCAQSQPLTCCNITSLFRM
eukprot:jgi/Astpho2/55/Aster-08484